MKKKALILMSFFAMAMTVALAQNPDKGNVRRPKPNVAPNPARIKNVILPARRTARKPVSKPGTAKQPARVNVRMGMQKNSGFPLNEIERCAFAHRSLFWI